MASRIYNSIKQFGIVFVVLFLVTVFSLTSSSFFNQVNFMNILSQISINAVVAIGMTLVILIGGIDLSVGSVVLLTGTVMGTLSLNAHFPVWLSILIGLAVGVLVGLFNGFLIEKANISPIVVTLGTMIAIRGLSLMILWINNSWLTVDDPFYTALAVHKFLFLPLTAIIMLVLYLIAYFVMKQTPFGRYIYAVGGNQKAAFFCGVPVIRTKMAAYTLSGFFSAVGGLLTASRLGIISPNVGTGMEFEAITAVLLGGTSLAGGAGKVEKTILGAMIVGLISNYLTIKGISAYFQTAVMGAVILVAVLLDRVSQGRRGDS